MRYIKWAVIGLALMIGIAGCTWQQRVFDRSLAVAQMRGTLRVGLADLGAPFAYTEDGQVYGYAADASALIARGMGLSIEWVIADREELAEKLAAYEIDMAVGDAVPETQQEQQYHLAGPYFHDPYVCVYPAERGDTEFTEIAAWEEDPAADESHILCPTWADALLTVDDGGAQAALMPLSVASALLYDWEGYVAVPTGEEYAAYMMVLRREDIHLTEAVTEVMEKVRDTSAFTDLTRKWYDILKD
jgi:ABC-type amino acid transport substrate-binding protein